MTSGRSRLPDNSKAVSDEVRDLSALELVGLFIDGKTFEGEQLLVVLGLCERSLCSVPITC